MRRTSACNSGRTCTGKNCVTKTNWNNCNDANRYGENSVPVLLLSVPGSAKHFIAARILCARCSWNSINNKNDKIAETQCLCWFQRFFIKAVQESLLGLVPRIKLQSHTVITIWYHIACNRILALRDTLFVNFILQTLAGKCGSREFSWKSLRKFDIIYLPEGTIVNTRGNCYS